MALSNTTSRYGSLTKTFHWLTALLILTALPLGYFAQAAPFADGDQLAHKAWLFSLHKTVGIAAFLVALLRILWAMNQTRPGLLNSSEPIEAFAAHTVHWLLYGSMLLVPLTGWIHHSATTGFAPIFWPFGQTLPFVPKSETLAELSSTLHFLLMLVLVGAILAHVGGAMKHFIIDRDQTLQRMLPGKNSAPETVADTHNRTPLVAALAIWALAMVAGVGAGWFSGHSHEHDHAHNEPDVISTEVSAPSDWQVQDGTLTISVHQFGSDVEGVFADWSAAILFDETATDGKHGSVEVQVAIGSLTLGSVTQQALGADFLDSAAHPTATFTADIEYRQDEYVAEGSLDLKGNTVAVTLPFALEIDGGVATMKGQTTLDRRDVGVGDAMADESSLKFAVQISVELTATRAP